MQVSIPGRHWISVLHFELKKLKNSYTRTPVCLRFRSKNRAQEGSALLVRTRKIEEVRTRGGRGWGWRQRWRPWYEINVTYAKCLLLYKNTDDCGHRRGIYLPFYSYYCFISDWWCTIKWFWKTLHQKQNILHLLQEQFMEINSANTLENCCF